MLIDPSKNRTCDLLFRKKFEAAGTTSLPSQNASERIASNRSSPRCTHNESTAELLACSPFDVFALAVELADEVEARP